MQFCVQRVFGIEIIYLNNVNKQMTFVYLFLKFI